MVIFAFLLGLSVDFFYGTLGVHAAAATFTGYIRQFALAILAPKDGYKVKASPDGKDLSRTWWIQYLGIMLTAYVVFYFSMEAFSPVYWQQILLKSLLTIPISWLLCGILVSFLRPPYLGAMQSAKTRLDNRAVVIRALFIIVAVLLLGKAAQLQIFDTEWNKRANRVGSSKVKLYPARGLITDRHGELLTINEPMYQIEMTYRDFAANNANFDTLGFCSLLNITPRIFRGMHS